MVLALVIAIKVFVALICAALFWWGGHNFLPARRFIVPTVLAGTTCLFLWTWWPAIMLLSMAALDEGYSGKSPLYKIFGPAIDRGMWGVIVGLCLSVVLLATHHLAWYWWLVYMVISFCAENFLQNVNDAWGDPVIGFGFASILFFI